MEQRHLHIVIIGRHVEIMAVRILKTLFLLPNFLFELIFDVIANLIEVWKGFNALTVLNIEPREFFSGAMVKAAIFPRLNGVDVAEWLRHVDRFIKQGN